MKSNNPILLIILQNQGIHYNDLLNKLSAHYSGTNSARAALSRALKDFSVLGLVARKEDRIYATDKAMVLVSSEMKNKLIARLNELVNSKNSVKEIDSIVQQIHILIERAKKDANLLKIAKSSMYFSLNDLRKINSGLEKEISHLNYIKEVFSNQINSLQEMDFNDSREIELNETAIELIEALAKESNLNELAFEFLNAEEKEKFLQESEAKTKTSKAILSIVNSKNFLKKLISAPSKEKIVLFISPVKIELTEKKALFSGPYGKMPKGK